MYQELEKKIGITFNKQELYLCCFTHRSYVNESEEKEPVADNERLEYLGDAVLEMTTTDHLFNNYPEQQEGELTALRAALVKGEHLAEVAHKLDLGKYLRLSKGEEASGGRQKNYILANTVEALIGAIYIDQGYNVAKKFIEENILNNLDQLVSEGAHRDAKSLLQEFSQEKFGVTPHYVVLKEVGPDHDKIFTMSANIGEREIATGTGSSKQKAEQSAASAALQEIIAEQASTEQ
ncbi:ribonuclease III [Candidatus Peregrinibacteria bacterium CG11_big_fil_rev_8_21_14_0_20_41_10]|nr:MAG: ribonuclease III [Candidatus Peregrinibacteria bacterium CG11_big_fil_rev_8_21_14_0_20_41_10]PJC37953.1 MAG: ribonuclease III [Candidatus Peregrinibacteria bacterium CG_4_9_14_0_2_um_filter_41_14]